VKNINIIKIYKKLSLIERITLLTKVSPEILATDSIECSYNFCRYIALEHYENFPVGSILIPKSIRKHFYAIYAFSRFADDIADVPNVLNNDERLKYLSDFEIILDCDVNQTNNPIFLALLQTIKEFNIPIPTFKKLITAFKTDVNFKQAETIEDLENYCTFSANPVGELILRLFDNYNSNTAPLSDKICTGLQLLNFWQDLSLDLKNGRNYIPVSYLKKYSLKNENLLLNPLPNLKNCIDELLEITEKYFSEGKLLINFISDFRLKLELIVIIKAGFYFLKKMKKNTLNLLNERPKLSKIDTVKILLKSLIN